MPTRSESVGGAPRARVEETLARAVVWRFLAAALGEPGDLRALAGDEAHRRALARAVQRLGLPPAPPAPPAALEEVRARLFGHSVRGGVCLYTSEYVGGPLFQPSHQLADLEGWYRAFGLTRARGRRERADHLAVQCEFLAFLSLREAYALEREGAEGQAAAAGALRGFLKESLAACGPAVAARLEGEDRRGFYGQVARLLRAMVRSECRRLGLRPAPRSLALRPPEPELPAACGASEPAAEPGGAGALLQIRSASEP